MTGFAAPLLEMLWEKDDPTEVIAARFGFADAAAAGEWVAATVRDHWGFEVDSVTRVVMSGHNALAWISAPSGPLLAKWSVLPERFPRLSALSQLTAWLGDRGSPVSEPLRSVDGRVQVEVGRATSISLQRQISGQLLDVSDSDEVRAAGAALAKLHAALAQYPGTEEIADLAQPPKPLAARITGHRIAAVLDFEEARFDFPIMELAQSAVMLGTRFRDWGPVSPHVHAWLLDGYESERPLTPAEASWWNLLVLWFSWLLVPPGEDPTGWGPAADDLLARIAV